MKPIFTIVVRKGLGFEAKGNGWLPFYTLVPSRDIGGKWGVPLKFTAICPKPVRWPTIINILGGFNWLYMPNFQFDVSIGFGLSGAAGDIYIGAGASARLPD